MKLAATLSLFLVLLAATPAATQIVPYWIPGAGCELLCGPSPTSLEYRHGTTAPMSLWHTMDHQSYTIERFVWDDANGLCLSQVDSPGMDSFYYTYSPPLARVIHHQPLLRGMVRVVLQPVTDVARLAP